MMGEGREWRTLMCEGKKEIGWVGGCAMKDMMA